MYNFMTYCWLSSCWKNKCFWQRFTLWGQLFPTGPFVSDSPEYVVHVPLQQYQSLWSAPVCLFSNIYFAAKKWWVVEENKTAWKHLNRVLVWQKILAFLQKLTTSPFTKGQLISKCLFWYLQFFQKTNENNSTWGTIVVKSNFIVRFLGEIEDIKKNFRN